MNENVKVEGEGEGEGEQRNVPLPHFPSGADGVEPGKVSDVARAKLEQSVIRMRAKLTQIADLALAAEAKSDSEHVKLGSKYLENSMAIAAIRKLVGPGLTFEEEIAGHDKPLDPTAPEMTRKHTMDFGRFHVTRAAIPGRTVLTFLRKQEHLAEFGTVVPGRIIFAQIYKQDDCGKGVSNHFVVKSCMPGESPRVLFSGNTWVCMSKTEKIVYKMVRCSIKETQRRHLTRKRKRAAAKAAGEGK